MSYNFIKRYVNIEKGIAGIEVSAFIAPNANQESNAVESSDDEDSSSISNNSGTDYDDDSDTDEDDTEEEDESFESKINRILSKINKVN